jgi:hypothetical protein
MNLRELSHFELWSRRTSWKVFLISAAFLVLGFALWDGYERYWITPGLRESGRKALTQIDELERLSTSCDAAFDTKAKWAERELKIADQREHTFRDIDVLFQLTNYLESTRIRHLRTCGQSALDAMEEKHQPLKDLDDRMLSSESELKQRLHNELE